MGMVTSLVSVNPAMALDAKYNWYPMTGSPVVGALDFSTSKGGQQCSNKDRLTAASFSSPKICLLDNRSEGSTGNIGWQECPFPPSHYALHLKDLELHEYPLPAADASGAPRAPDGFLATRPDPEGTCRPKKCLVHRDGQAFLHWQTAAAGFTINCQSLFC